MERRLIESIRVRDMLTLDRSWSILLRTLSLWITYALEGGSNFKRCTSAWTTADFCASSIAVVAGAPSSDPVWWEENLNSASSISYSYKSNECNWSDSKEPNLNPNTHNFHNTSEQDHSNTTENSSCNPDIDSLKKKKEDIPLFVLHLTKY